MLRKRSTRSSALLLLALFLGGCGLGDYEEEMKHQQVLFDRREKENDELGDPVTLVRDSKSPDPLQVAWNNQFFFRLPRGLKTTPDDHKKFLPDTSGGKDKQLQPCFVFTRDESSPDRKACRIKEVLVLSRKWDDPSKPSVFDLDKALKAYPMKRDDSPQKLQWSQPVPRQPMEFYYHVVGRQQDTAYVFQAENRNYLVVFHVDILGNDVAAESKLFQQMEMSLETLTEGDEARKMHQFWEVLKKQKGSASASPSAPQGSRPGPPPRGGSAPSVPGK
jgi:hypothetical protein